MADSSSPLETSRKRFWKPYYIIELVILIFSLGLTFLLIAVLQLPLKKYKIKARSEPKSQELVYFFHDFDQDGFSEKVELKNNFERNQPAVKVYTYYNNLLDQWNFQETWLKYAIFGDFNHDHQDEAYFFTHNKDSLFLYGLDIRERGRFFLYRRFITAAPRPNPNNKKVWDIESIDGFLLDTDDDGYDEVVFFVNTGFALQPRQMFAYSVKKGRIVARSPKSAAKFGRLTLYDFNDDGYPEILNSFNHSSDNYDEPYPFRDNVAWLFLLNKKLEFVFPPLEFPPLHSSIIAMPWRIAEKNYIAVMQNYRGTLDLTPMLFLVTSEGKIKREKKFSPLKSWEIFSLPSKERTRLFVSDRKNILMELNSQLEPLRHFNIEGPLGIFWAEVDLDGDLQPEYLFRSPNGIWLFEKDFKYQTGFEFQLQYLFWHYQVRKRGDLNPELVLQNPASLLYIQYSPNPFYPFRYLLMVGFFLFIWGIIQLGSRFTRRILFRDRFLKNVLHHQQKGICLLDYRGEIEGINARLERILLLDHHIIQGESYRGAFTALPDLVAFISQLIESNEPLQRKMQIIREEKRLEIQISGKPLTGWLNSPLGYIIEVVENNRMWQDDRIRVWSKTVQKMAHDIKTPLSAVQLSLQTLQMKIADLYPEAAILDGDFKLILQELQRVREMTRNFLKFTNLEEPNRQLISLKETLESALRRFSHYFNDHLKIQLELDEKHDSLWADPQQLEMVFQIVIENAIDALQGKGIILISTNLAQYLDKQFQSFVEIDIADTGSGIAQDQQERVFEPYFTTKSEGTGMGLTIARKIVEDHGGEITIVSRKGFATVVRIMLPIGNIEGEGSA